MFNYSDYTHYHIFWSFNHWYFNCCFTPFSLFSCRAHI